MERPGKKPRRIAPHALRAPRRKGPSPNPPRLVALRVLERVERTGAYADLALHANFDRSALDARERAFATELAYGTLRWRGRLDFLLAEVLDRKFEKLEAPVTSLLRLGAYQLVFVDSLPNAVAVSETVRLAQSVGLDRASGLINAVLRRLGERWRDIPFPELKSDPIGHLTHALSLPPWLAERWLETLGAEEAAALALACNTPPPRSIRNNRTRQSREVLLDELRERFPDAVLCAFASDGILLGHKGDAARDPAFLEGRFTIQDEAAQVVIDCLDPQPGEQILDLCAAPGAKATAIAERIGEKGHVLGVDRHERRLGLLARDARRLSLRNVETLVTDATQALPEARIAEGFDRVLVDAPCSGLGTLRRNPDARWRLQADAIERLAETQLAILRRGADVLRPGGVLVYSTCTITHEENESVIAAFLDDHSDFSVDGELPARLAPLGDDAGALRMAPHLHQSDAFYMVRLRRASS